jgi:hypothetical protein
MAIASACPNRWQMPMLCGQGSVMPYSSMMSTVPHTHSRTSTRSTQQSCCVDHAVAESHISEPHSGPPFEPTVTHSRNIALSRWGGKTGASAADQIGALFFERIVPWGGWKSTTSAERYVNKAYRCSAKGTLYQLFDFMRRAS